MHYPVYRGLSPLRDSPLEVYQLGQFFMYDVLISELRSVKMLYFAYFYDVSWA